MDFGYAWPWTHGHLVLAAVLAPLLALAVRRKWHRWARVALALALVWALTAFAVIHLVLGFDRRSTLPTEAFLSGGPARVLDLGAGTGRSTLMVLEARPEATVVALDLFGDSYVEHFGRAREDENLPFAGTEALLANLGHAGVENRATVAIGDMRQLEFPPASFDAIVSAYAIDHLRRADRARALTEAARVCKPGGEFLLMVLTKDFWLSFVFGPLMMHGGGPSQEAWAEQLRDAGFEVVEQGRRPGTLWFLARKAGDTRPPPH